MAEIDDKTRRQIAAHLRRLFAERGFPSVAAMATRLDMSRSALGRYMDGERTVGLDVLLKIHREFGVSIDALVDLKHPPEERWFEPSSIPGPSDAPRLPARPEGRKAGGGR